MFNFNEILERLKETTGKSKNKEIAEFLETNETNFSRWVGRNKIPYEQLTNFCYKNGYDLMYILTGKSTNEVINNQNNNENSKIFNVQGNNNNVHIRSYRDEQLKILEELKKLPEKRQKYYYHIISAEVLEFEE
ncbi:hypothetical protein CP960_09710 [Malaciobacter halophilus]|uniref:Bacteriophage CI repressor N-terminal domain-containing protein n=1 Tax=Malaciobacter halophilus TaxID=197482 RepID=A0A2N1J1H6_9BACT|nr:helix-turn-helix domain-containing protein [Malaciobacter halophilus]AXH09721.1 hypothetical protein AHALO_1349 [Malaciobacter halophilus]PKI80410.1 hypothetical protein CP960_09710 [Malaciobacter halophilus]